MLKYIVIPGRHHSLTTFQGDYLKKIATEKKCETVNTGTAYFSDRVKIIFAITSANHSNTKRNPLPLEYRTAQIAHFSAFIPQADFLYYGIEDKGVVAGSSFAEIVLEQISTEGFGTIPSLTPENTAILVSTPQVMKMYIDLGFSILPAEFDPKLQKINKTMPWELVMDASKNPELDSEFFTQNAHPATKRIWGDYQFGHKIKRIFSDPAINQDGEFTETRDILPYVFEMDKNMKFKFEDIAPHILPGKIGDVGCAAGSLIKLLSETPSLSNSSFIGIDGSRNMIETCHTRCARGDFKVAHVYFRRDNGFQNTVFERNSMDTIHTGSTLHEVFSYGDGIPSLKEFVSFRFKENKQGGVFINRDVIGPENGDELVYMWLSSDNGRNSDYEKDFEDPEILGQYLSKLSTGALFERFKLDFRKDKKDVFSAGARKESVMGKDLVLLSIRDAMEFCFHMPWINNWKSECKERLAAINQSTLKNILESEGYEVLPESRVFVNEWQVKNQFEGHVELYEHSGKSLKKISFPPTHIVSVARKK